MTSERVPRQVIDGHSHIGEMAAWKFYDLKEPVKPTVYEFATDRRLPRPPGPARRGAGAGAPELRHPGPGPAVLAEPARAGRHLVLGPAVRWPLGLDPAPEQGADPRGAEACRRERDRRAEDHVPARRQPQPRGHGTRRRPSWPRRASPPPSSTTSSSTSTPAPAAASDISNFIPLVERYGKRVKIYLVHFGGGVSGPHPAGAPVPRLGRGGLQGLHRHHLGRRLRGALAAHRDRAARGRPRPGDVRLRRAVERLLGRVLEDRRARRSARS